MYGGNLHEETDFTHETKPCEDAPRCLEFYVMYGQNLGVFHKDPKLNLSLSWT